MMPKIQIFVFIVVATVVNANCPHEDPSLVSWNTASAWAGGQIPGVNGDGTIIGNVLLDVQPAAINHLTIASTGKLVFDPNTEVHLDVNAIFVDGELWLGSETCRYTGKARVTFHGNVMEQKALLVRDGGTIELHGPKKLSWTKLAETAQKLQEVPDILEGVDDLDLCNDRCNKGLLVYVLEPSDGSLISAKRFDLLVETDEIASRIDQFEQHLQDIPIGKVVGIAIKNTIIASKNYDLVDVFVAIESLTGYQTSLLEVDAGSAYALLFVKGQSNTAVEEFEKNVGARHSVVAKMYHSNYAYVLESEAVSGGGGCTGSVSFRVYDDDVYRPTLKVLDDASTWVQGDKLVLASTDYHQDQTEVVEVLSVSGTDVRISGPLNHVHYGEMYKGVDFRAEIGLLSRPVKFDSEDAATSEYYGGHIKIMHEFKAAHIEGVELENLGQQEQLGSYSLHFHMAGRAPNNPYLKENSIHHTNSRCVTIHNTHGVLIENNVCYHTIGHSYFLEDGSEQNNTFNRNLGLGSMTHPSGFRLIPTDSCPTTFWVTNPKNTYTNNAAAGSECRGFWFNFPDYPLYEPHHPQPEEWMQTKEARFTRIREFFNNVAHSNRDSGLFIDNIVKPDGTSSGYNKYRPMINPTTQESVSCITDSSQCVEDCVIIDRYTGYKNSRRNIWARGGCIIVERSGLSDSLVGTVFLRDKPGELAVKNSIFVGDSANIGQPADGFSRSLPRHDQDHMHLGLQLKKGLVILDGNWFGDFKNNEKYKMGAIGFSRNDGGRVSVRNGVLNAQFGFSDPSEGNRLVDYVEQDSLYTNKDGDDNSLVRDLDGSLTEHSCPNIAVIRPEPFHLSTSCQERSNWGLALCCETFGEIKVKDTENIDDLHEVRMTRDDDVTKFIDSDMSMHAPFLVMLGGQYSYTMTFLDQVPTSIVLQTQAISNSDYVRVGVCLPKSATLTNLRNFHPGSFGSLDKWTKVDTLNELDTDTAGGKYLYHSESGYFATVLRHRSDFIEADKFEDNPEGKSISMTIEFTAADVSSNDCIETARTALGGSLAPQTVQRRRLISLFKKLLRTLKSRTKRSTVPQYSDVLPADSVSPPQNYGAGSSHTQFQMQR